ncbi:hypothetical protein H8K38_03135 [Undibacterium sp. FT79W]|uniref:hypothetical protein n=1 Tax=Undibacterium sp. FT79W TaxID=2762296 RepID=UPI00164C41C5|nr:hypothetical protein [Undibacterium sp. FT79W]MBC3876798.1 hypothetical protein [Undibacterium sp. FT79W]
MKAYILPMRRNGIALPKRRLFDQYNQGHFGELSMSTTSDQGLHRVVRLARFVRGVSKYTLFEPQILWLEGDRMMLSGFERVETERGDVEYAQSWLCILGENPAIPELNRE